MTNLITDRVLTIHASPDTAAPVDWEPSPSPPRNLALKVIPLQGCADLCLRQLILVQPPYGVLPQPLAVVEMSPAGRWFLHPATFPPVNAVVWRPEAKQGELLVSKQQLDPDGVVIVHRALQCVVGLTHDPRGFDPTMVVAALNDLRVPPVPEPSGL